MFIYVALTFWLMVGLLEAYAIFKLFEGLVRPRWINVVLLPGTIVAELAHFLAALLTGAPVREARLVSDESVGQAVAEPANGIPLLSPLLMALLPILSGLTIVFLLYQHLDSTIVVGFAGLLGMSLNDLLADKLYWNLGQWFNVLRNMLHLAERLVDVLLKSEQAWKPWLFVYLTACLSIRMVPLRNNLRSGMAAVLLIGGLSGLLSLIVPSMDNGLQHCWPLLAYVVAMLTLLLLIALLARGAHALALTLYGRTAGRKAPDRRTPV